MKKIRRALIMNQLEPEFERMNDEEQYTLSQILQQEEDFDISSMEDMITDLTISIGFLKGIGSEGSTRLKLYRDAMVRISDAALAVDRVTSRRISANKYDIPKSLIPSEEVVREINILRLKGVNHEVIEDMLWARLIEGDDMNETQ